MTVINTISADHWTTTARVRGKLDLPHKNAEPDYEEDIVAATNSIQAKVLGAGGYGSEADLPSTEADLPQLLREATTYWAAYESYGTLSSQLQNGNNNDSTADRFKSLAEDKLADWRELADLDTAADNPSKSITASGRSESLL